MSVTAAARKTAATASRQLPTLDALLCGSLSVLHRQLPPGQRLASLDVTSTHISLALSDKSRRSAVPFGILARTNDAKVDAKILTSVITRAVEFEKEPLQIAGLVVAVPPTDEDKLAVVEYARDLLERNVGLPHTLFPNLKACVLYSEAHALLRAVSAHRDFMHAIKILPPKLESKRESLFDKAMYPKVTPDELVDDVSVKTRISASEVLQAVLDKLETLDRASEATGEK